MSCGHVEFGETLKEAVRREVKEETGLDVYNLVFLNLNEFIHSTEYHRKEHFIALNYTCKTNTTKVKLNEEADKCIWIAPKEALSENVDSLSRDSIKEYLKTHK